MNNVTTYELNSDDLDDVNGAFIGFVRTTAYNVGYALGKASKLIF